MTVGDLKEGDLFEQQGGQIVRVDRVASFADGMVSIFINGESEPSFSISKDFEIEILKSN